MEKNYDGIDSYADADHTIGVYAEDDSPDKNSVGLLGFVGGRNATGIAGINESGVGSYAESESGVPGLPALQMVSQTPGTELFDAQATGTDGNFYQVATLDYPSENSSGLAGNQSVGGNADFRLNGDEIITGALYSGCPSASDANPGADCDSVTDSVSRTSAGTMVRAFWHAQCGARDRRLRASRI